MLSLTENGIYLGIHALEASSVFFQSKNAHSFKTVHKVRNYITALNFAALAYSLKLTLNSKGMENIEPRKAFIVLMLTHTIATYTLIHIVNHYFYPNENKEITNWAVSGKLRITKKEFSTISAKWKSSDYQTMKKWIQVMQIVFNIGTSYFQKNPYPYALATALQFYSLTKTSQWEQIEFKRIFDPPESKKNFQKKLLKTYQKQLFKALLNIK